MDIHVDRIRISSVMIDASGNIARWIVSGYYITKKGTIIGEFRVSSDDDVLVSTGNFIPTIDVQELTGKLLTELHSNIESHMQLEYEQKDNKSN